MVLKFKIVPMLMVLLFLLTSSPSFGWWDLGHEVVAQIADQELQPETRSKINKLLQVEISVPGSAKLSSLTSQLVLSAPWADYIKISPLFQDTYGKDPYGDKCHFLEVNLTTDELLSLFSKNKSELSRKNELKERMKKEEEKSPQNILSCIKKSRKVLEEGTQIADQSKSSLTEKAIALRYLVHLIGDLHQPMHNFSINDDQGGNKTKTDPPQEIKVYSAKDAKPSTYTNNLHFVWDAMLGVAPQLPMTRFFSESELNEKAFLNHLDYSQSIAKTILNRKSTDLLRKAVLAEKNEDLTDWSYASLLEGVKMNYGDLSKVKSKKGQPLTLPLVLNKTKEEERVKVVQNQLLLAGLRLGVILNQIFKKS